MPPPRKSLKTGRPASTTAREPRTATSKIMQTKSRPSHHAMLPDPPDRDPRDSTSQRSRTRHLLATTAWQYLVPSLPPVSRNIASHCYHLSLVEGSPHMEKSSHGEVLTWRSPHMEKSSAHGEVLTWRSPQRAYSPRLRAGIATTDLEGCTRQGRCRHSWRCPCHP